MGINERHVNAYFVMGSRLYMKSGNSRSEYVTVIKGLKIQELSGFDVVKFSK